MSHTIANLYKVLNLSFSFDGFLLPGNSTVAGKLVPSWPGLCLPLSPDTPVTPLNVGWIIKVRFKLLSKILGPLYPDLRPQNMGH